MMHWMRSAGKSYIAKGLFIVLVGSFGIWGIGPIFSSSRVQNAATAGNEKIPTAAVEEAFRQQLQMIERQYGISMTAEQAAQYGLKRQIAQQLVMQSLYNQEAARMGIAFDREVLKQTIALQPSLRDESGKFNPQRFSAMLQTLGMNEGTYLQALRGDLSRTLLLGSMQSAASTPALLAQPLYNWANEKRVALVQEIKASEMTGIAEPTADELKAFYDQHQDSFMAPEYRSISYILVDAEKIAAGISVSEEDIKAAYDAAPQDYGTPEKRTIAQITTQDQAVAEKIATEAATRPLQDVAKENNVSYSEIELTDGNTFPDLNKIIFSMETGKTSQAVKSPMGWHVLHLVKVTPAETKTLAQVHDQVAAKLRHDQAAAKLDDLSKQLQDTTAGGATLAEAAKQLGLDVISLGDVSSMGKDTADKPVPDSKPAASQAIQIGFSTDAGQVSPLQETEKGLIIVGVDKITPAQAKPLDSIKADVVKAWRISKQQEMAQKKAQETVDRLNKGEEVAWLTRTPALARDGSNRDKLPKGALTALFAATPGTATLFKDETSTWVIKLVDVIKPEADAEKLEAARKEMKKQMGDDLIEQFANELRARYGANLNEAWLNQASAPSAE